MNTKIIKQQVGWPWPSPHGFVFGLLPKGLILMEFF